MRRALMVSAAIAVAAFGLASSASMPRTVSDGINSAIASIDGVRASDQQVTIGVNYNILPSTFTSEGHSWVSVPDTAIERALTSPAVLSVWALCGPELRAEAQILRGYAHAIYTFPKNAPFNYADEQGGVTASDAAAAEKFRRQAARYDQAAQLANQAKVPCVRQGRSPGLGNYVPLPSTDMQGQPTTLYVPEYEAVTLPVEYFAFVGHCPEVLSNELARVMQYPVDSRPGKRGTIDTFTERDKANSITRLTSHIEMLRVSGVSISCR